MHQEMQEEDRLFAQDQNYEQLTPEEYERRDLLEHQDDQYAKEQEWRWCWGLNCHREPILIDKKTEDGPYGNKCPICQRTLREHPFFGCGTRYDMGDSNKQFTWNRELTDKEKADTYEEFDFPIPNKYRKAGG